MRTWTLHFFERVSFGAAGHPRRFALSSLRPRGGAASLSSCRGARFDAVGRSGDSGPGAGSVSLRARTWGNRAGAESLVSRRAGSGETRAYGNGAWHAADVRGFGRCETGGTHLWEAQRSQGVGIGRGYDQRASGFSTTGSRDRTAPSDEPLARAGRRTGQGVWRKDGRLG